MSDKPEPEEIIENVLWDEFEGFNEERASFAASRITEDLREAGYLLPQEEVAGDKEPFGMGLADRERGC